MVISDIRQVIFAIKGFPRGPGGPRFEIAKRLLNQVPPKTALRPATYRPFCMSVANRSFNVGPKERGKNRAGFRLYWSLILKARR